MTDRDEEGEAPRGLRVESKRVGTAARTLVALLLLGVLPVFLRLWPIDHGAPHPEFVPDTHVVRNALHMAADRDLVPPAGAYSTYPYLLPYTLVPVYAADYLIGKSQGLWADGPGYGNHLRENPWRAHRLARIVLALIASLTPLFVFLAGRAAGLRQGAWVAAWLAGTSLLHVHFSLHERPWAPMMAPLAACLWAAILHVRTGSLRSLLGSGFAAAIAASMHQGGLPFLGITGLAWACAPTEQVGSFVQRVRGGVLAVLLFALTAAALGYPYYFVHGEAVEAAGDTHMREGLDSLAVGGQRVVFELRAATFPHLAKAFIGYDPALLLLGLGGIAIGFRRRLLLPGTVFLLAWGALWMTNINEHVRYLLPMAILLALPAGVFAERILARAPKPVRVGLVLLLALPLVQSIRLGALLRQPDTRLLAEEMLQKLPPGSRVAIDLYGPILPATKASLETLEGLRPLYARESFRYARLLGGEIQDGEVDTVHLQNVFEFDQRHGGSSVRQLPLREDGSPRPRLGSTAREALTSIGATHLLLVDRTPDDGRPAPLVDPAAPIPIEGSAAGAPPVAKLAPLTLGPAEWQVHPGWTRASEPEPGSTARNGQLPMSLSFPLFDLWRVKRPGPALSLHGL